jgi:ABC-type branched-subunit amino acid transport system substrate-binding protein
MVSTTAIALLVIGLVVGAGVGYGVSALTVPTTTTTSTATRTIDIGSIEPESNGGDAIYGISFREAVQLAVSQMNANLTQAGNPIQFKVVYADDQGSPAMADSELASLYSTDNIHVVIGPLTSAEVAGVLQTADTDHIVVLPPAATAVSLRYPKGADNYLVRPGQPGDQYEGSALAQTVEQLGAKNVVFLYRDDTSESGTFNASSALLQAAGINVQGVEYQPSQTDYGSIVTTAASDAQTMLSSGGTTSNTFVVCACDEVTEDQNIFTHAMSDTPLSSLRWFGIEAIDTPSLYATSPYASWMSQVNFTMTTPAAFSSPQLTYFNQTFIAMFGSAPQPYSNYAYDNAFIAMDAILMTGGQNNGTAILSAIYLASDHYFGATGTGVWLDSANAQTFAIYNVVEVTPAQTTIQIGQYNGATNQVTLTGS